MIITIIFVLGIGTILSTFDEPPKINKEIITNETFNTDKRI